MNKMNNKNDQSPKGESKLQESTQILYLVIIGGKGLKEINWYSKSSRTHMKLEDNVDLDSSLCYCQYQVPSDIFDSRGRIHLHADKEINIEGAYLLAEEISVEAARKDIKKYLKDNSILYKDGGIASGKEIEISQVSHSVSYTPASGQSLGAVNYDRENNFIEEMHICAGYRQCKFIGTRAGKSIYQDHYGNKIEVKINEAQDRINVQIKYKIKRFIEEAVPISLSIPLDGNLKQVEYMSGKPGTPRKIELLKRSFNSDDPRNFIPFTMAPFILARRNDNSYISFVDDKLENLMFDRSHVNGGLQINITRWLYPARGCDKDNLSWSFSMLPGYGDYYNAMLRGMCHCKGKDKIRGSLGAHFCPEGDVKFGRTSGLPSLAAVKDFCKEATQNGVKVVWYHGWFWRNGMYFPPVAEDESYTTIWSYETSLNQIREIIKELHKHGIKVCAYFQFAGVSEDVKNKFLPSLVRDDSGKSLVVGYDGRFGKDITNIYADPNPEGLYAQSVLKQVERALKDMKFDGVALDRTDRFDCTDSLMADYYLENWKKDREFTPVFDHAHFDGSANPVPYYYKDKQNISELLPCSSMALQGKKFLTELRKLLDKYDAWLLSNIAKTPFVTDVSDAILADIFFEPETSFYYKALSKDTACCIIECMWDHDANRFMVNTAVAALFQAYPHTGGRCELLNYNQRLLAVVPGKDDMPEKLFFENGYTVIPWKKKKKSILERYSGSYFEYYRPVNEIKRITVKKDFMEITNDKGGKKRIPYI